MIAIRNTPAALPTTPVRTLRKIAGDSVLRRRRSFRFVRGDGDVKARFSLVPRSAQHGPADRSAPLARVTLNGIEPIGAIDRAPGLVEKRTWQPSAVDEEEQDVENAMHASYRVSDERQSEAPLRSL